MSLKVVEHIVRVSHSFNAGETPCSSASHQDPICLHMALKLYFDNDLNIRQEPFCVPAIIPYGGQCLTFIVWLL